MATEKDSKAVCALPVKNWLQTCSVRLITMFLHNNLAVIHIVV